MAAAFFNQMTNTALVGAVSGGSRPAVAIHPQVLEAMREVGVDLAGENPTRLTPALASGAKYLVTMGCGEECPAVPGARREDWQIADPAGQGMTRVREIRDEIKQQVWALIAREGWWKLHPAGTEERED